MEHEYRRKIEEEEDEPPFGAIREEMEAVDELVQTRITEHHETCCGHPEHTMLAGVCTECAQIQLGPDQAALIIRHMERERLTIADAASNFDIEYEVLQRAIDEYNIRYREERRRRLQASWYP